MNKPNIVSSLLGIALGVYVLITSLKFPQVQGNPIGPGYFPVMLSTGMIVLSLVLLIQTILKKGKTEYEKLDVRSPELIRSFLALVATIVYAFIMQIIGFIVASVFYLIFLMYLLKNRNYKEMVIVSVIISVVVYAVFKGVLNLTLPSGFLI